MNLVTSPFVVKTIAREEIDNNGDKIEHVLQPEHIMFISFFLEDVSTWREYAYKDFFNNSDEKTIVNFHNGEHYIVIIPFHEFCKIMATYKKQEADLRRIIISN